MVSPRNWPVPLIVLTIVALAALGYPLSARTSGAWQTAVNVIGGTLITALGVTLADRLRTRSSDDKALGPPEGGEARFPGRD